MRHAPWTVVALVVAFAVPGCLQTEGAFTPAAGVKAAADGAMVAVVEGGIAVYHEAFRVTPQREHELAALGERLGAMTLHPTFDGTLDDALARDAELWAAAKTHTLYRIAGTNLFTYSVRVAGGPVNPYDPADGFTVRNFHAAAVIDQAKRGSPDNIILVVQTNSASQGTEKGPTVDNPTYPDNFIEAFAWVRDQPWVDVVSVSVAHLFHPPDSPVSQDANELAWITRDMVSRGQLVVWGAGNFVAPGTFTGTHGVPWAITVGGMMYRNGTMNTASAKLPDFVADWQAIVPDSASMNATRELSGTSLAAPAVAGRMAAAISDLRRAAGLAVAPEGRSAFLPAGALGPSSATIGPWEVRSAFNVTATLWSGGNQPEPNLSGDPINDAFYAFDLGHPVPPELESTAMGWGYVGDPETQAATALLLEYARTGDRSLLQNPTSKGANTPFMEQYFAFRQAWFDTVLPDEP